LESTVRISAKATGTAGVAQFTLVHIGASVVGIASVSRRAGAGEVAGCILAQGLMSACLGVFAFVNIGASGKSIALETGFASALVMGRQVAALGVLHAFGRNFRHFAFIDICTGEAVALVARKARTREATQSVGALSEHVARTILAFVLIWSRTSASSVTVIAVTFVIETGAVLATRSLRKQTITGALELGAVLV